MPGRADNQSTPRSTRGSASSAPLLTPVYEMDGISENAIASSSGSSAASSADDEESEDSGRDVPRSLPVDSDTPKPSTPRLRLPASPSLPSASFSFGSCPSVPLSATPTHELGPFDYPLTNPHDGPSLSRRGSLALGMTHRRGSIVSRSPKEPHPALPLDPPTARRSSTCSTITTLPSAGRRPSILHSASTNSGAMGPASSIAGPSGFSPTSSRRNSLLFPQKPLVAPIPPSLLNRRGSLPAAQLFGVPSSELRARSSLSSQGQAGYNTTTPALYHRRGSVLSDDGSATSSKASGSTITYNPSRRESFRVDPSLSPDLGPTAPAFGAGFDGRGGGPQASFTEGLEARRLSYTQAYEQRRQSYPHPPAYQLGTATRRRVSNGSRLSGPSFSSSDGSAEDAEDGEDGAESDDPDLLPTPGTAVNFAFGGFTDPWAGKGVPVETGTGKAIVASEDEADTVDAVESVTREEAA